MFVYQLEDLPVCLREIERSQVGNPQSEKLVGDTREDGTRRDLSRWVDVHRPNAMPELLEGAETLVGGRSLPQMAAKKYRQAIAHNFRPRASVMPVALASVE